MALSFNQFTLKGKNGRKAIFAQPYLNDNKELELKYCNFFIGQVVLNEEKRAVELKAKNKSVLLLLRGENEALFDELMSVKKEIIKDLNQLTRDFQSEKERIYAIEMRNEEYPFFLTSPTILENGRYSSKYIQALLYILNVKMNEKGKKREWEGYEDMLRMVGQKIKKMDVSTLPSGMMGENKFYVLTINQLVELL